MLARSGQAARLLRLRRAYAVLARTRTQLQLCACEELGLRRACHYTVKAGSASYDSLVRPPRSEVGRAQHSTAAALAEPPPSHGKIVPFNLADIGEGIAEVEIMQWFVKEGDQVKQFDRLCEVQSDKATVEITSRYDGIIRTAHHKIGSMVKVGTPLVDIELMDGDAPPLPTINNRGPPPTASLQPLGSPQAQPFSASSVPSGPPMPTSFSAMPASGLNGSKNVILTTPAVRRLAKESGTDLSMVRATGPQGRVLKGDVLEYLRQRDATLMIGGQSSNPLIASVKPLPTPAPVIAAFIPPSPPCPGLPSPASTAAAVSLPLVQSTRVPVRGVMRQMIKAMTASLKIPHFGYQDEVIMDELIELRRTLKSAAESQGIKLSYLPIMVKAASLALHQYPILNSSLSADEKEVIFHSDHNIGVAMDTSKGLLVPVVKRVQDKSILMIAKELTELQKLAASGSFSEEHLTGATFSLSNIGTIGGTYMDPKIVPPQVAIGAIGRIQKVPRFGKDGTTVVPAHIMAISWSGDHRVIDGATMARFSNLWKSYLESPATMLATTR